MSRDEAGQSATMNAVAPVWDGNETWLIFVSVILWGAFPVVYAVLLSAFYLPVILMLAGLILGGVAFDTARRPSACVGSGMPRSAAARWSRPSCRG